MTQSTTSHYYVESPSSRALVVGAIGVVFGDIGTSPLYSLKECFSPEHGIPFSPDAVLGIISMLFWAFVIVVSLKYVMFVMRADNNGEGGILALMALALRTAAPRSRMAKLIMMFGIFGACMFYGDAVITPAISVLSAVEGLEIAAPGLSHFVIPITLLILALLFFIQRSGTHVVGKLFGPIMVVWFLALGALGLIHLVQAPGIVKAINPVYAVSFLHDHSLQAFIVLGSVFLVLTGAEALYADMGHFGAKPIRTAWFVLVMPCLILNYFGQGAMLLGNPDAIENPFYLMVPSALQLPMVLLATAATVIASQAVISGAFSLTSQAIQLGFMPRMRIRYTSAAEIGQIYMPVINWILLVLVICVVLAFKKSDNLAAAYGIAVTTTMVITTFLAALVMRNVWKWNPALVTLISLTFLVVDMSFFAANLLKIAEGGWFPLLMGGSAFFLLMTWHSGRKLLRARSLEDGIPLEPFIAGLLAHPPHRVEGTAVFLTGNTESVPVSLLHNLKHNRVLHERVVFLQFVTRDIPYVDDDERLSCKDLGGGVYILKSEYGFKETPDVQRVLDLAQRKLGMQFELMETSFFIARESVIPSKLPGMSMWRESLFAWMHQNGAKPSDFFSIPANRVVELGTKVEI
ncbi:KUP system potassium uptake protein [Cupriavidus metallidurans]|jgi:KUP system potassium uptake protein|uniref:Probable potassium transport system protein Kup n=1 Tax=Cupriavidus metallidurans (strain ATCC 43123 / DSM 2839 / NBRC 102507 / CH34) TaxID=266264 RepID=KUP_CUPMC|nr:MULTISPECIES: potassium transporter Kup [Cupriavidus]Q1LP09.2 RecName: Full=Probable potassium transport system protein Kup [Cupriavidus metallidurans CH34]AVA33456.1 potassium transporter Kup [Cupriavidus metallidurans]EKZ98266.1 putative potassium transport system protein kup [Cupriavidus sp. HMR-1]MDE4917626.1 potassium transporter Kup [Cupriavidus metallidurans]QGS27609.1 potassium transporter Kup [Cupriavidus metallidurans]UBM12241.1 potassium transporter Kup [Cupriavidus metalliduran